MTLRTPALLSFLIACLMACGGDDTPDFIECRDNASCDLQTGGACLVNSATGNQFCAYPDATCESGMRWSDLDVEPSISGDCVAAATDGGVDAPPLDAMPDGPADAAPDAGPTTYAVTYGSAGIEGIVDVHPVTDGLLFSGTLGGEAMIGSIALDHDTGIDWALGKLDENGSPVWAMARGGANNDIIGGSAADGSGDLIVVGAFAGTVNYGGSNLTSAGSYDVALAKYDGDTGAHVWSVKYGATGDERPIGVTVDAAGDVYVIGYFGTTGNLGGSNITSAGMFDAFLAKYSGTNGAYVWGLRFGSTESDYFNSVAVDGDDVFVTGRFRGTVNFGGGNRVSAGQDDIVIASYAAANGNHQWSERYGSTNNDTGVEVVAGGGSVYATGSINGSVTLGGNVLVTVNGPDIFVAKYDGATGSHTWSKRFGTSSSVSSSRRLLIDGANLIVTGEFASNEDFGGGAIDSAGNNDVFVATLTTSDGSHVDSYRLGGASDDGGSAIGKTPDGLVVGGYFSGVCYFGSIQATSEGMSDAFLHRP